MAGSGGKKTGYNHFQGQSREFIFCLKGKKKLWQDGQKKMKNQYLLNILKHLKYF
jgi:hypothetical protein